MWAGCPKTKPVYLRELHYAELDIPLIVRRGRQGKVKKGGGQRAGCVFNFKHTKTCFGRLAAGLSTEGALLSQTKSLLYNRQRRK